MPAKYTSSTASSRSCLAGKEVIEAPAVDARGLQQVGDAGRAVALLPEELHSGLDQAVAGGGCGCGRVGHVLVERSTKRVTGGMRGVKRRGGRLRPSAI